MSATCRCCFINPSINPSINQVDWNEKTTKWLFGGITEVFKSKPSCRSDLLKSAADHNFLSNTDPHTALCLCSAYSISACSYRPLWMMFIAPLWLAANCIHPVGTAAKTWVRRWRHSRAQQTAIKTHIMMKTIFPIRCVHAQLLGEYSCFRVHQRILDKPDMFTTSDVGGQELCFGSFCGKNPCAIQGKWTFV